MLLDRNSIAEKGLLQGDTAVWMIFLTLCTISIIEVYSASSSMSYKSAHYWAPVLEHSSYLVLGIIFAWFIHLIPCNMFKIIGTGMLHVAVYPMLVFTLFTAKTNGASRWIELGGKTIQPSEFAKLFLVIFVAFILSTLRDEKGASKTAFWWVFTEVGLTVGLIFFENASTAAIILLVMLGICFIGQVSTKYLSVLVGSIGTVAAIALITVYSIPDSKLSEWSNDEESILHRVPTWVNRLKSKNVEIPEDPNDYQITDRNTQITHAYIAVAGSNIIGRGPGNSVQRDYLPQAYSDFIYAIIIEEGGVISGILVILLYLLLAWRAMKIAQQCKALFPSYLVMGLTLMMVVQAMVNMAVAVGAFPVTGQPLPLISRGGTSTFVSCAYIGIILSVSRTAKKIDKKKDSTQITSSL